MPLRHSTRSQLAALIIGCAALLVQACATTDSGSTPASTGAAAARAPLWRVIDGGITGGNALTGPARVQFMQPVAVAARGDFIYVLDVGHRKLFRYDTRVDRLSRVMDLDGVVSGIDADLYVMPDLSFFIADTDGARVLHYDRDGRLIKVIDKDRIRTGRPVSVEVNDMTGYIFVADGFNDVVLVYNPEGLLEGIFGGRGLGPGLFTNITAFSQGPQGYYVGTRLGDNRVQVMGLTGGYRESFESETVRFPTAIAVSRSSVTFVSDYLADDIKVFDVRGTLVDVIGGHGTAPGRFKRVTSLWLNDGFLYVADSLNQRIQILSLASWDLSPPEEP